MTDNTKDDVLLSDEETTTRRRSGASDAATGALICDQPAATRALSVGAAEEKAESGKLKAEMGMTFLGAWLWLRLAGEVSLFEGEEVEG